jgi:RHS repeat-associated protein
MSFVDKFTGKERDSESGLDNFGARYDSSSIGRFMSPDPENVGASPDDPQSWNAYAYVMNNPMNSTDPDGLADCPDNRTTTRISVLSQLILPRMSP